MTGPDDLARWQAIAARAAAGEALDALGGWADFYDDGDAARIRHASIRGADRGALVRLLRRPDLLQLHLAGTAARVEDNLRTLGQVEGDRRSPAADWWLDGMAAAEAYHRTGQVAFADVVTGCADVLDAFRDDRTGVVDHVRGVPVPSWSGRRLLDGQVVAVNTPFFTGLTLLPMTSLALFARARGGVVPGIDRVVSRAVESVDALLGDLVDAGEGALCFRSFPNGDVEPSNHVAPFGAVCAHLGELSGEPRFTATAHGLATHFRRSVTTGPRGAWSWHYYADGRNRRAEQVWKAAKTVLLPLAMSDAGLEGDVRNVVRTFLDSVWAGGTDFRLTVDDRDPRRLAADSAGTRPRRIQNLAGWAALDRADSRVGPVIADAVALRPDLFPHSWWGSGATVWAYASNLAPAPGAAA